MSLRTCRVRAVALMLACTAPVTAAEPLVRIDLDGRRVDGMILARDNRTTFFLARDGQCLELATSDAQRVEPLAADFQSYSQAEIRGLLMREFGQGFEVSGVGHYLVVHPTGQKDQWAPRFESLYRSFVHYFAARGWRLTE